MIDETEKIFKKIAEQKVILFLGAGASITEEKGYLSKHLIEYYRDLKCISYNPPNGDIVDFVDKVFSIEDYDRDDFDYQVSKWLRENLYVTENHKFCATLPWLSIITTNIDLLLENTIEEENFQDEYEFIRNLNEFNNSLSHGDKCKVIKLHGCISDISAYKPLFSTMDFSKNYKFYNKVFSVIEEQSPDVSILFVGYSFKDAFGSSFLNTFQERFKGREFFLVDPFVSTDDFNLKYLKSKNINPIAKTFDTFLDNYKDWYAKNSSSINKSNKNIFFKKNGVNLSKKFQEKIQSFIIPLNQTYDNEFIDSENYYLGKEPNYNVIKANYDVIKESKITEVSEKIEELFQLKQISYPFVFLKGSYGTGKSTFAYRLIKNLIDGSKGDLQAFELIDITKLNFNFISELINKLTDTKRIIIYSDQSEQDLNFKRLRHLRGFLSSNQYLDKSIILLQSIRENNLERFKRKLNPNINEINIDCEFNDNELITLLEKLKHNRLINYRSEKEKQEIIKDIKENLKVNDQLIISLYLIKNGNHYRSILDTYNNFQYKSLRQAFLYTCLLYQYGIKMPISLLRSILDKNWESFIKEIIEVDGKGIFIQEKIRPDYYLKPDLYFKIKHKLVAENFINNKVKKNKIYNHYLNLVQKLPSNEESIFVFINLIQELSNNRSIDEMKINYLYDVAYKNLKDFSRFNIYYAKNLQYRKTKPACIKAIELLEKEEYSIYDTGKGRNKFIIHRKACLNYQLAKLYIEENDVISEEYLDDAIELFEIKENIDPNSIFSYKQFIELLLWYLKNWDLNSFQQAKVELKIHNLINKGIRNVQEGINQLLKLQSKIEERLDRFELQERIDDLINDPTSRPIALILKYEMNKSHSLDNEEEIIEEMENYLYNDEIGVFLFNYYGNRLQYYDDRIKFFKLIRNNEVIEKKESLNFYYYNFIAESYNYRFRDAFDNQKELRNKFKTAINKEPLYWKEQNSQEVRIFKGKIIKTPQGYFNVKIINLTNSFKAKLDNRLQDYSNVLDEELNVKIFFSYTGIWAEIVQN